MGMRKGRDSLDRIPKSKKSAIKPPKMTHHQMSPRNKARCQVLRFLVSDEAATIHRPAEEAKQVRKKGRIFVTCATSSLIGPFEHTLCAMHQAYCYGKMMWDMTPPSSVK
jgi:hypothetical protein